MPRHGLLSSLSGGMRASVFARLSQQIASHTGPLFPLHIGDAHLPPEQAARIASAADLAAECHRYGPPCGVPALVEALVEKVRTVNGLTWVAHDDIQVTAGATHALYAAARAVLDPGDEVILPSPFWPLIDGVIRLCNATPRQVPFYQALYQNPDADPAELLEPHITSRTAALYLISPNNPDGKVLSRRQLERLADLALRHDLWVLSDEVYENHRYADEPALSIAALPGMAERTLSAFSFSKSYAMPGLRLGYVVAPSACAAVIRKISNHTVYNVPVAVQRAALCALGSPSAIEELRRFSRAAREEAIQTVRAPFFAPEGASYLFLDLSPCLPRGATDCFPLLERALGAGVLLAPGDAFGVGFDRYARLCFTSVPLPALREAIERLNGVLLASG